MEGILLYLYNRWCAKARIWFVGRARTSSLRELTQVEKDGGLMRVNLSFQRSRDSAFKMSRTDEIHDLSCVEEIAENEYISLM